MKSLINTQKEGAERIGCSQEIILNGKEIIHLSLSFLHYENIWMKSEISILHPDVFSL